MNIELESDGNLIWRAGGNDCRVILTRFQLFVPRITFNSKGQEIYLKNYLKPYKWMYLNEVVERSNNSQQQTGHLIQQMFMFHPQMVEVTLPFLINLLPFSVHGKTQ